MSIGYIIRNERIKRSIKQINLARGICSTSYLSKIENNSAIPNGEILQLLLKRLNITVNHKTEVDEINFIAELSKSYKEAVLNRDKEKVMYYISKNSESQIQFRTNTNYYQYILKMFRLRLIAQLDLDNSSHTIELIASSSKQLEDNEVFLLNFNLALYSYDQNDFVKSLSYMEKSLDLLEQISIEEWEKADFFSALSIIYGRNHHYIKAIHYAKLALSYFHNNFLENRTIDCYIVLGNSYKCLRDTDNAINSYTNAQKIAQELKLDQYEAMFSQNLASLMVSLGDDERAVNYFLESLSNKEEGTDAYFLTVVSLVKIYSKKGNSNKVLEYCDHAIKLIEKSPSPQKEVHRIHSMHLRLFKELHINGNDLEETIKKTVKFFEALGDLSNTMKYSILMTNYYYSNKQYKASAIYQEKVRQIIFTQKSIKHWEEL